MKIKNKIVIITGGGSGMGAGTAQVLSDAGAKVALLDHDFEAAKNMAEEIDGFAVQCDVSQVESAERAIKQVIEKLGGVTICINCAGIAPAARIVSRDGAMPLDDFNRVIQVNLVGTFNIMRLCAEQMMKQECINDDGERGVIINTSSIAACEGQIGQAAYSASKGGVTSMMLPAAREFAKFGIRVLTIAPGVIATPMMSAMPDTVQKSLCEAVSFPKRLGDVKEYASLVKEIIKNTYLNGCVIRLDGAMRMAAK